MQMIESLTHHGMGRTADGTLVARTLPGEAVELLPDSSARIITPSPDRVSAPCRHFRSCGGCSMQHASDGFVAEWKLGIVAKALAAHGLTVELRGIKTSGPQSRRRAKLSGRRTKSGAMVGFHARGTNQLVAVPDCQLLRPALMAIMPVLEAMTVIAASRKSEVGLTVTESRAGIELVVDSDRPLTTELREELAGFAQTHGLARLVWRDEIVVTINALVQRFGLTDVVPPPGAFMQATAEGEAILLAAVRRIVGKADRIVDLFAGCGTFALPLAQNAEVHAVETDGAMLRALDSGWRSAVGLKRVSTEARDLFRRPLHSEELRRFDAAVIDPPRAGAEAQVQEIARSNLRSVAMVSCNPVTFARDARDLIAAGFTLGPIDVIDQFRWSAHVELVAAFTRT